MLKRDTFDNSSPFAEREASKSALVAAVNGTVGQVCPVKWSLWDMLRVYAEKYVDLGQDFQEIEMLAIQRAHESEFVDEGNLLTLVKTISSIEEHCKEIGLKVTARIVDKINEEFTSQGHLTWALVGLRISEIGRCFRAELESTCCYMIASERVKFYSENATSFASKKALAAFPSAQYDLTEAGKCFATERFTACVSHLMKAAEWPLRSLASFAGVPAIDRASWNTALRQIRTKLEKKEKPFDTLSKEDEEYFTGLEGFLRTAKTAWRNPSSHVPRIYIESQAKSLFEVVRILLDNTAQRLNEANMVE